jgi:CheY-like chemotaxis protein
MSGRLLLVEDEPDILLIGRASLKRAGFDVVTARDGLQALAAVAEERPSVIVMDCLMPELDGFETCARLQADPATREIPIVFLTARSDTATHQRCLALGAVGCIAKPFDPLRLGEQVKALAFPPRSASEALLNVALH